jgi:hypothetical protein
MLMALATEFLALQLIVFDLIFENLDGSFEFVRFCFESAELSILFGKV